MSSKTHFKIFGASQNVSASSLFNAENVIIKNLWDKTYDSDFNT